MNAGRGKLGRRARASAFRKVASGLHPVIEHSSVHGRQLSHIDMLLEGGVMTTLRERI
jgi:hypothetical protein